jgi:hypothetical protein
LWLTPASTSPIHTITRKARSDDFSLHQQRHPGPIRPA